MAPTHPTEFLPLHPCKNMDPRKQENMQKEKKS